MQQKQLNVDDGPAAIGDAIGGLIADIKAGKTVLEDAQDAFSKLVGAVGSLGTMGEDIKKVDNQVYILKCIAAAFEPAA